MKPSPPTWSMKSSIWSATLATACRPSAAARRSGRGAAPTSRTRQQLAVELAIARLHALQLGLGPVEPSARRAGSAREVEVEMGGQDRHARPRAARARCAAPASRAPPPPSRPTIGWMPNRILHASGSRPSLDRAALDVGVVGLRARRCSAGSRRSRRRTGPRTSRPFGRRAGLQDRRAVLRRAHDVERTARLEEAPGVLDAVHLGGIGEDAGLAIHDDGVLAPSSTRACGRPR